MQTAQFQLETQRAKINSVNVRAETHGTDHVPAVDISISVKLSNDSLAFFDPSLKFAMYSTDTNKAKQNDLVGGVSDAPVLRFPSLSMPLQWDWSGVGYDLTVHYGVSGHDITLKADIDKFRLDCMDGGTVEITFRAQAHPEESQIGRLATLIQCEVDITLDPPKVEATKSRGLDLGDPPQGGDEPPPPSKPKRGGRSKGREDAEDAFV